MLRPADTAIQKLNRDLALSMVTEGSTQSILLSSLRGQVLVLFVFGIDCGTCKHLAGTLSRLQTDYLPEASFLGVCVQNACHERLSEFRQAALPTFLLASCRSRDLYDALELPKGTWLFYPTLVFIDQEQQLRGLFIGENTFFTDVDLNTRALLDFLLKRTGDRQVQMEVIA